MSALRVAFLTLFLDLLGFGLIIPIAPFYAESFGASPFEVTLITASYSLMQFLFAPLWGSLSDRFGRRPIILISIAIAAVGFLVYGFATSLWMLFAARMIAGFGNANVGTVHAIAADVTTPQDRARAMGMLGAAFGLGFIVGPVFGGILGGIWGPNAPAFAAAGLCAINLVFAFFKLPETRKVDAERPHSTSGFLGLRAFARAKDRVNVPSLLVLSLLFTVGFAMMEASLGLFVERTFLDPTLIGTKEGHRQATLLTTWLLLAAGVVSVIVQGGLIRRLKGAFGEKSLIIVGCLMLAVALAAVIPASGVSYAVTFAPIAVLAFGSGLYSPSASSLLSRASAADEQGSMLSLGQSMSALGRIIGPATAGYVFQQAGKSVPFFVGAGLMAVCVVVAATLRQPRD